MIRQIALFLCAASLFMQCGSTKNELGAAPAKLISPAKMADILAEIHMAEARVGKLNIGNSDSAAIVFKRLQNNVFAKAQVDTATYTKSYVYYSSHPAELAGIYEQVIEKLKKGQQKREEELRKNPPKRPMI
ncbi:DUF4296 domain-containing protein [Fibrella sp. HMF5335]|uniref:DUF4296 domain-containing protein n=1 Tax=Fibrella rubiginis TaxID=2817060 RepID=A0A939GH08_9BACT|nr:DUF4296 domain-containing protein [Fibrella rubiginis]MBO0936332.1 DUF4296 domain-containing protein [Fibrella rubiginis]